MSLNSTQTKDTHLSDSSTKENTKYAPVAVIVPAYNEETTIHITLESLLNQTKIPEKIIVVDDFSADKTSEIAASYGVTVIRPPSNTGSKAGAQNFALPYIESKYTIALDADSSLSNDAIEKMCDFLNQDMEAVAACSFVIPKKIKSIWERGRFIEYIFVFPFYKRIQDWYGKPMICSGCFSIYRTEELKSAGGWSTRTMAEDMDLTWSFYEKGKSIRYNHEAYCFPIEPENFSLMSKQLKRWSHAWVQNFRLHRKKIMKIPVLREEVMAALADATFGGLFVTIIAPVIAIILNNPLLFVFGIASDVLFIAIPTIWKGYKLKRVKQVMVSLPSFFILRIVNTYFFYEALISEIILKKRLTAYEKGH